LITGHYQVGISEFGYQSGYVILGSQIIDFKIGTNFLTQSFDIDAFTDALDETLKVLS